jgi:hypothetical protein
LKIIKKKKVKITKVKILLELKEWAEEKEFSQVKRIPEIHKGRKLNRRMRELHVRMLYNPRYSDEKEKYIIDLNALKAKYNFGRIN